jgi:hypothetical protein
MNFILTCLFVTFFSRLLNYLRKKIVFVDYKTEMFELYTEFIVFFILIPLFSVILEFIFN